MFKFSGQFCKTLFQHGVQNFNVRPTEASNCANRELLAAILHCPLLQNKAPPLSSVVIKARPSRRNPNLVPRGILAPPPREKENFVSLDRPSGFMWVAPSVATK